MACVGEESELSQLMEVMKWIESKGACEIYYYMAYCIMHDEISVTGSIPNAITSYTVADSQHRINLDDDIVYN